MAHDGGGEQAPKGPRPKPGQSLRGLVLLFGGLAACIVIAVDVVLILRAGSLAKLPLVSSASVLAALPSTPPAEAPRLESALPALAKNAPAMPPSFAGPSREEGDEPPTRAAEKRFATVQEAVIGSCTTASVEGLSRQIIEQARCLAPKALVPLPSRPNLELASNVFPYLEVGARDRLLRALDSRKNRKMTINSAFRTVAQQYLVWRWSANKRCGVQLATPPGESNHEVGRALDIAEEAEWRKTLEAHDFRWLGASDPVHFDFEPKRAPAKKTMLDVLAFQKLWNKNNRKDRIAETGRYDAATEQRLKKAPPAGFPRGPSCDKGRK